MSAGSEPARATFWLLDAPDSLSVQSHREPDGTGLGWFDDARRHTSASRRTPRTATAGSRARHARCAATTFLAHIRFASTGALEVRNTHPFEQQGRLFAHNGVIEDLPALEAHLGDDLRLVKGDTDSERFFALITREIAAHDGDVARVSRPRAAGWPRTCRCSRSTSCLPTATGLWALRYPETHPLYVLERDPGEPLRHESSLGTRVHAEQGASRPLAVLASERMDGDPGWRLLAAGELVHIDDALRVEHADAPARTRPRTR